MCKATRISYFPSQLLQDFVHQHPSYETSIFPGLCTSCPGTSKGGREAWEPWEPLPDFFMTSLQITKKSKKSELAGEMALGFQSEDRWFHLKLRLCKRITAQESEASFFKSFVDIVVSPFQSLFAFCRVVVLSWISHSSLRGNFDALATRIPGRNGDVNFPE